MIPVLTVLFIGLNSACVFFSGNDRISNLAANAAQTSNSAAGNPSGPVPESTLAGSNEDSPPVGAVEELRAKMLGTSPAAARERHPASEVVGDGCAELSFALLESKGDRMQYIGIYRCSMKGAIAGISSFDSQVQVIGEIGRENGAYAKRVVSAEATN
jgi:hypothetical protein